MTDILVHTLTVALSLTGALFFLAGTIGLLRLPDFYSRVHAATKCDTVGAGAILLALAIHVAPDPEALKILALLLLVLVLVGPLLVPVRPLPGVDDPARVKDLISSTAFLEFQEVVGGPSPDRNSLLAGVGGVDVVTNAEWTGGGAVQTAAGRLFYEMPSNPRRKRWGGYVCSGTVVTEKIFERPGLGTLFLDAFFARDIPVVQGCVLVIAVIYVIVNLVVDLAYGVVDPRVRLS